MDLPINVITVINFLLGLTNIKDKWNNCCGVPGIVYNFNNQNPVTLEDNLGCKSGLSVVVYIDFETTAPTDSCFDTKQKRCLLYHAL